MKGLKKNKQDEKGKLERSKLTQTCLSQKHSIENRPSEPNLAQARSLQRSWSFSRPTLPSKL